MKMKNKKNWVMVVLLIVFIVFLAYKSYNLVIYSSKNLYGYDYDKYINLLDIHDEMKINFNSENISNYLTYKNIKIRNDFENYEISYNGKEGITYQLKDENGNLISVFKMGEEPQYIDYEIDSMFKENDRKRLFKNNNIKNDVDLYDFIIKKNNSKNNLFTSINKIKENSLKQYYTSVLLGKTTTYTSKITGYINGYLTNEVVNQKNTINVKNIRLFKDNKVYFFSFWINEKFTDEYIKDILSTLVIENSDTNSSKNVNVIVDEVEKNHLSCAEALEKFYEDEFYVYEWSCIKNSHMKVKFEDGSTKLVSEALEDGSITITDLDKNKIKYYKSINYEKYKLVSTLPKNKNVSTEILVRFNNVLYGRSNGVLDYAGGAKKIGDINKVIDSQYVPKLNNETNFNQILNAEVYESSNTSIVLFYDNEYVLFEKVDE